MIELAGGRASSPGGAGTLGKALARLLLGRGMGVLLVDANADGWAAMAERREPLFRGR